MIKFFTTNYTPTEIAKMVRNLPPQKWPEITDIVEVMMERGSREQKLSVFKKVFEVFSSRAHRKLSGEEQAAIWKAWKNYGTDQYANMTKWRYIMQRINNEVMWLPESLREKAKKAPERYQEFCKDFFEEKSREWKEIPVEDLEDWLEESKEEFREIVMGL